MSIETWKQEHYPVEAKEAAGDDLTAARHSFAKWQGLTPEALAKHGLTKPPIDIDSSTCALCVRHYDGPSCGECPILEETDGCSSCGPFGDYSYIQGDPAPMIKVLRDCVAWLESEQGGKR